MKDFKGIAGAGCGTTRGRHAGTAADGSRRAPKMKPTALANTLIKSFLKRT